MKTILFKKRSAAIFPICCLMLQLLFTGIPGAAPAGAIVAHADTKASAAILFDGTQSAWAEDTLIDAYETGLTYPNVTNNYKRPITREEFATIAVKLYEKLSGKTIKAGATPFSDTSDPEIIKANQLGIVLGTAPGVFSPNANIKRQEMAAMIQRALSVSVSGLPKPSADPLPFSDRDKVAAWAMESVKFAYQNQIINGMGNNQIAPLANTTREQAIAIIKRAYDAFSGEPAIKSVVRLGIGAPPIASEQVKFKLIDFSNRLTAPDYDTRLTLFAATDAAKPSSKPVGVMDGSGPASLAGGPEPLRELLALTLSPISSPVLTDAYLIEPALKRPTFWSAAPRPAGSYYSSADCAAFIDWNKSKLRYFAFRAGSASGAANVVWQVSKTPFNGFADNWTAPRGLVAQGSVPISAGEFVIDFAKFAPPAPGSGTIYKLTPNAIVFSQLGTTANPYKEIPKTQYKYYVRAVPVTAAGVPAGDPGEGIAVLYGKPLASASGMTAAASFDLWTTLRGGSPSSGKEFPNTMENVSSIGVSPLDNAHWFQVKSPPSGTTRVVVQVAVTAFSAKAANWEEPAGLVYTRTYTMPLGTADIYPNSFSIPFASFGPSASTLTEDEFVDFYVRTVAIKPSNTPGAEDVSYSETIHVSYGTPKAPILYRNETITVPAYTPSVRIAHYEPIKWEDPDWAHHYVVFRAPKWNEIGSYYKNSNGEILAPYAFYAFSSSPYYDPAMTIDKYENQLIPKFLKVNTKVYIPPPVEADKSWWEELWDDIVDFFSDLVSLVKDLTNWVSNAYNNLRSSLISFVADNFPGIPDSWRAGLRTALEALVNTGLAALGLPPSLPNFDQLTGMSVEYLAGVALTQAGIPANEITEELMEETMEGITQQIGNAAAAPTPNPISAPFLKADPAYLYRPAFIDVELSNDFDKPSLPGSFSIDAEWEWTENVHLDYETFANKSQAAQFADAMSYVNHFVYGLSRGHQGYPIYYTLFEPERSKPIPILQPGEKQIVRIYLKEYIGKPYAFAVNGDPVYASDFAQMYFGTTGTTSIINGKAVSEGYDTRFRVYVDSSFNLPPAKTAAAAMDMLGTDKNCIYTYSYNYGNAAETFEQIAAKPYK